MKSLVLKITVILLFSVQIMLAQEEEDNIGFNHYSSSVFDSKANALNLVSKLPTNNNLSFQNQISNGILIQQIGEFNEFSASFRSELVNVSIYQKGIDNQVLLDKEAKSITQKVVQEGNNNQITDFSYYSKYDVNMQMIQQGSNQNIQNYGTNSLSKDMTVTQTGNGATVIIINQ